MDSNFQFAKRVLEDLVFNGVEPNDSEYDQLQEILYKTELPNDHLIVHLCTTFVNRCIVMSKVDHISYLYNFYNNGNCIQIPFNIKYMIRCYSYEMLEILTPFIHRGSFKRKIYDMLFLSNSATSASMMYNVWFTKHEYFYEIDDDSLVIDRPAYCNYRCTYLLKLHTAAKTIQTAFRNAIVNPYTQLCKRRLLREFNSLCDERQSHAETEKNLGMISDCIYTCVEYAKNPGTFAVSPNTLTFSKSNQREAFA